MAITLSTAARNAANDAIVDLVDAGSTYSGGQMLIKTAGGALLLATLQLPDPAFGASAAGTATLNGTPITATAAASGTAAVFEVTDKDGTVIYSGTVGISGSGADAIIDSTTVTSGDTVQLNSHTVTAPS